MNESEAPATASSFAALLIAVAILLLPVLLAFWARGTSAKISVATQKDAWARFRGRGRLILTCSIASWWAIWGSRGLSAFVSRFCFSSSGLLEPTNCKSLLFWSPPVVSLWIFLISCYAVDRRLLKLHWPASNLIWRAWWRLTTFVIPLLMLAAGFDALMDGKAWGIAWFFVAGVVAKIGTAFLRRAEGIKLNTLKSGELRNRALLLAKEMGITLQRVFIVPSGKGHLTNAFGMSSAVGLTDNLGKYLTKEQVAFVIGHELAHVKLKHGRKQLLLILGTYSCMALLLFRLPHFASPPRPILRIAIIVIPVLLMNWFSRRFEYAADREAARVTREPEVAIRALINLYHTDELPGRAGPLTELFMTHPAFTRRIGAIALGGRVPPERLADILVDAGIVDAGVSSL
jgi:Zn-dependent protease with chaperone function